MDNNSTQVTEFTVEFSTPYYTNSDVNKFGSDDYNPELNSSGKLEGIKKAFKNSSTIIPSLRGITSKLPKW